METKKNQAADLNNKSGYFFSIGLFLSIGLIASAFEWVGCDPGTIVIRVPAIDNFNPLIEIPMSN